MPTFGDLRAAIEDARLHPIRLGGVIWCVLHAPDPESYDRWVDYAHDALAAGDPAAPLAQTFAFCVDGFDVLSVAVATRQRILLEPHHRLERQDLVLFVCALAYSIYVEDDEPQVAREGIYVDVTDGEFELSWPLKGGGFAPGLNTTAASSAILAEHLTAPEGGVHIDPFCDAFDDDVEPVDLPRLPGDPDVFRAAPWRFGSIADPAWTRVRARELGVSYRAVALERRTAEAGSWAELLKGRDVVGRLTACAPHASSQHVYHPVHADSHTLATQGSLVCASLTLTRSTWLVRGDLAVDRVLEVGDGTTLVVLGDLDCGALVVIGDAEVVVRGDVHAESLLLEPSEDGGTPSVLASSLTASLAHAFDLGVVALASGTPQLRLAFEGDPDTEDLIARLESMTLPIWHGPRDSTPHDERFALACYAYAMIGPEAVLTPDALHALTP